MLEGAERPRRTAAEEGTVPWALAFLERSSHEEGSLRRQVKNATKAAKIQEGQDALFARWLDHLS